MEAMTVVAFNPVRDKSYADTSLGRDVAAFLDWKALGGSSPRTLDQYERDLARGALMFPDRTAATLTDQEAIHIAKQFKGGERRVRVAAWNSFHAAPLYGGQACSLWACWLVSRPLTSICQHPLTSL